MKVFIAECTNRAVRKVNRLLIQLIISLKYSYESNVKFNALDTKRIRAFFYLRNFNY